MLPARSVQNSSGAIRRDQPARKPLFGLCQTSIANTPGRSPKRALASWLRTVRSVSAAWAAMLSYRLGEFSQVQPLARGTAPLVVTVLGVPLVPAGLGCLVLLGRRQPLRGNGPAVAAAVATGLAISAYTAVDGLGVRLAGARWATPRG